ncbi:MAG: DUF2274 domain-containing protein [Oricola sp.]|jgi:hypothetical protein|nr:DUF2274 domain-containing protein [Oricola sp.]
MSLKLGPLPDRNPVKLSLSLTPDVHDALCDYASLHAKAHGREPPLPDLAALMIEEFLNCDAAFKRARKTLEKETSSKE